MVEWQMLRGRQSNLGKLEVERLLLDMTRRDAVQCTVSSPKNMVATTKAGFATSANEKRSFARVVGSEPIRVEDSVGIQPMNGHAFDY